MGRSHAACCCMGNLFLYHSCKKILYDSPIRQKRYNTLHAVLAYVLSNVVWIGFFFWMHFYWYRVLLVKINTAVCVFAACYFYMCINNRRLMLYISGSHLILKFAIISFLTFSFSFLLASSIAYRFISDNQKPTVSPRKKKWNLKTELSLLRSQQARISCLMFWITW